MAPIQKKELAPGDSTVVELVFNSRTSKGKLTKNARIISNDSTRSMVTIDFTANIFTEPDTTSPVRYTPYNFELGKDSKKIAVNVLNRGESQLKLSLANQPSEDIKVKFKDDLISGGETRKVELEWKGETPEYDITQALTFNTGDVGVPRFTIPFTIKGEKGPKPGTKSQHAATKPPTDPKQAAQSKGAVAVPGANLQGKSDTVKTANPIPAANWPPK